MDDTEKKRIIREYIKEICHYSQMQVFATSVYQKRYLEYQIDEVADELTDFILVTDKDNVEALQTTAPKTPSPTGLPVALPPTNPPVIPPEERVITLDELHQNDGSGTNLAYVAVNGIVYDVTNVIRWGGGTHFGLYAGSDLTAAFTGCHNGMQDILKELPIAGKLKQE